MPVRPREEETARRAVSRARKRQRELEANAATGADVSYALAAVAVKLHAAKAALAAVLVAKNAGKAVAAPAGQRRRVEQIAIAENPVAAAICRVDAAAAVRPAAVVAQPVARTSQARPPSDVECAVSPSVVSPVGQVKQVATRTLAVAGPSQPYSSSTRECTSTPAAAAPIGQAGQLEQVAATAWPVASESHARSSSPVAVVAIPVVATPRAPPTVAGNSAAPLTAGAPAPPTEVVGCAWRLPAVVSTLSSVAVAPTAPPARAAAPHPAPSVTFAPMAAARAELGALWGAVGTVHEQVPALIAAVVALSAEVADLRARLPPPAVGGGDGSGVGTVPCERIATYGGTPPRCLVDPHGDSTTGARVAVTTASDHPSSPVSPHPEEVATPGGRWMSKAGREARFSTTVDRFRAREAGRRSGQRAEVNN